MDQWDGTVQHAKALLHAVEAIQISKEVAAWLENRKSSEASAAETASPESSLRDRARC